MIAFYEGIVETTRPYRDELYRSTLEKLEKQQQEMEASDAEYATKADRITTLLIANKCTPPDHLASWKTYEADERALIKEEAD